MKISFSATFLTSLALGFLFITGRSIIEGAVFKTGINYQILGFEFTDYAFYGFIYCYHYLLFINLLISLSYLLYHCFLHRLELKIRFSYIKVKLCSWVIGEHKNIDKEKYYEIKRNQYNKARKFSLLDELLKQASFSYVFFVVASLLIYWVLLIWISKSNDGQKNAISDVLEGVTYVENSGNKFFLILCGKERCVYATKDFKNFYNTKKDEINAKTLERVDIKTAVNSKVDFKAYKLHETKTLTGKLVTFQINLDLKSKTDKTDLDCLLYLVSSSPKVMNKIKDETHYAVKTNQIHSINNSLDKNDTKAYFISYFLPNGQELKNLYFYILPSSTLKSGCLPSQPDWLNNNVYSSIKSL